MYKIILRRNKRNIRILFKLKALPVPSRNIRKTFFRENIRAF